MEFALRRKSGTARLRRNAKLREVIGAYTDHAQTNRKINYRAHQQVAIGAEPTLQDIAKAGRVLNAQQHTLGIATRRLIARELD